jgi:hypothetical protein
VLADRTGSRPTRGACRVGSSPAAGSSGGPSVRTVRRAAR